MAATGLLPSAEQLDRMVTTELDRDMLFQRALELDLHLYDTVVYQRLLRNMSFLQLGEGMSEQEQYQQALEMRLHLGDEVVKRRLIQVMEQLLLGFSPPEAPTEEELRAVVLYERVRFGGQDLDASLIDCGLAGEAEGEE